MKKLNNKGFSLAELLVVVAILGILSGVASASMSQIFASKTRKFIDDCDAMLTRCRVETLSGAPSGTHVEIGLNDGKYYVAFCDDNDERTPPVEKEILGDSNAICSYYTIGSNDPVQLTSGKISISYNRTTGAMNENYTAINVSGRKIILEPATGYHRVGG